MLGTCSGHGNIMAATNTCNASVKNVQNVVEVAVIWNGGNGGAIGTVARHIQQPYPQISNYFVRPKQHPILTLQGERGYGKIK